MSFPTLTRMQVLEHLTNEADEPLTVLPWWTAAWAAIDDPSILEIILKVIRQSGKSTFIGADATTTVLTVPNSYVVLVSASEAQQQAIYHRKIRRPLERLLSDLGLRGAANFTRTGVEFPDLNSALVVLVSTDDTTPGRTMTRLYIDEGRYVRDEVYAALAPSTIGGGGKIIIASTAGPPRGFFYELVTNPTEATWLYESATNENPRADQGVLSFIRRRLSLLMPAAAQRELGNVFADDGDSFLPAKLVDAAVDDALSELETSDRPAFGFLDLSRKKDLTSLLVVVQERARRPEAADHLVVATVQTWNPKDSPTGEVPFEEVRAALARLPGRFPRLRKLLVDEGAEAGAVLPWARQHARLSARVEGFVASATSNMDLWSALSARLHAGSLSLPRHERLIAELKSLRQESFALGSRWRVIDASRKLHRDVSVALAGACFAAGEARTCTSPLCEDPQCDGRAPFSLLFTPEADGWDARHPPQAVLAAREAAEAAVAAEDAALDWEPAGVDGVGIKERLAEMVKLGFSRAVLRSAAREATTPPHEERVRARLAADATAADARAQRAARDRAAARLAEDVKRGGGVWFPGD